MGLDVHNSLFCNFHLNWSGTRWFKAWCEAHGLPEPFVGWVTGWNDGDLCVLGPSGKHQTRAKDWCAALEEKVPEIARVGKLILENPPGKLTEYLYPQRNSGKRQLSEEEWGRRAVAAWYAILRNGIEHGDILEYL